MAIIEKMKKLGGYMLDLVFPVSCLVCGREGTYLCENCQPKLSKLINQECLVCQKPSPFGKTHPDCITRNSVDGALAALNHKDPKVSEIIRTFKYNFVSSLANPLATMIVETIKREGLENYFAEFIIVPVPLHNRRLNWRGFNQAGLLANSLAENLKISVNNHLVTRSKFTKPQVTLTADDRKKNIQNAFTLTGEVGGKKILLVDDVVTSGSTANELAKLFKQTHAAEVWIATAAHG